METGKIIIRVYGIYNNPELGILVSDEIVKGRRITKFPGGGLEYGEGPMDCLRREMIEETGSEFEILSHFYTTSFFVNSVFHADRQVVSIYYTMHPLKQIEFRIAKKVFDFEMEEEGAQSFRYILPETISEDSFSLVVDREVGKMLSEKKV
jgi:ADP-ribose pyrophosphatase YjhB (NUDIX family)